METVIDDKKNLSRQVTKMCETLLANNELTFEDLAEYLNLTEKQLSDYCAGLQQPAAEIYGKIYALSIIKRAAERNASRS